MTKYRFILSILGDDHEVKPIGTSDFGVNYSEPSDAKFSYDPKFSKPFTLAGDDYKLVHDLDKSDRRCQAMGLTIQRKCDGGSFVDFQKAIVNINKAKFDEDRCTVELEVVYDSPYACYNINKKTELNLFNLVPGSFNAWVNLGTLEYTSYNSNTQRDFWKASQFPEPDPEHKGWILYEYSKSGNSFTYRYVRETIMTDCNTTLRNCDLVQACTGGQQKWARHALLYDRQDLGIDTGGRPPRNGWDFPLYYEGRLFKYTVFTQQYMDNGMKLSDVMNVISNSVCGIPTKSNFFQINPDGPFLSIYPTLKNRVTENVLVFQKSDVKRPNDYSNATKALTTAEKFLDDLCKAFNLKYIFTDDFLIIEHASFWGRSVGIDITQLNYKRSGKFPMRYSYLDTQLPEFETFKMMEQGNIDFVGTPIEYKDVCATKGQEDSIAVENVTTDIEYCLTNGVRNADGQDSGKVVDEGFVLMACEIINSKYAIIQEDPILDKFPKRNNSFAWAQLHQAFFAWDRPQIAGYMNNVYTVFKTAKPMKKGEAFTIPFCCSDVFKLTDLIKTPMGEAIVGESSFNFAKETFTFEPLYMITGTAFICTIPSTFSFISVASGVFKFNIAYTFGTVNDIDIEVRKPDNSIQTKSFQDVPAGEFNLDLGSTAPFGNYQFKARVNCGAETSEWTNTITVNYMSQTVCDATIADTAFTYVKYAAPKFTFRFTYALLAGNSLEVEVTRPDAAVFVTSGFFYSVIGGSATFDVPNYITPFSPGPNSGQYKFRYRLKCPNGISGAWSAFKIVNL